MHGGGVGRGGLGEEDPTALLHPLGPSLRPSAPGGSKAVPEGSAGEKGDAGEQRWGRGGFAASYEGGRGTRIPLHRLLNDAAAVPPLPPSPPKEPKQSTGRSYTRGRGVGGFRGAIRSEQRPSVRSFHPRAENINKYNPPLSSVLPSNQRSAHLRRALLGASSPAASPTACR